MLARESPFIVGMGGTVRSASSSEKVLRIALQAAEALGARTQIFAGETLVKLPLYVPGAISSGSARTLIAALKQADGVFLSSPGYHGSISGLLKNALDYVEELRDDDRPYFSGRAVGCMATAHGWQGAVTTLQALRDIAHALRGWPTPLGVPINTLETSFNEEESDDDVYREKAIWQLKSVASEVVGFACWMERTCATTP